MIKSVLVFCSTICLLASCESKVQDERPNVLIIFIDDMGYGDLGCYGNPVMKTPNIDKLASKGLKFTNFYVNSPICSPSRVALNTGRYPMRYRIHSYIASMQQNSNRSMDNYLDPNAPTIAKTLQKSGYSTGHFGKWHMGGGRDLGDVPHPNEYGFDQSLVSFEGIGNRVLFPGHGLSMQSAELGRGEIIWEKKAKSTSIYVDHALDFVKSSREKPFFINLCPNDVHDPFLPDPKAVEKWEGVTDNHFEQKFFAVLEEMDNQIGRLIDGLEKMDELDNTIIIISSDNGPTDWPFYSESEKYPADYEGKKYPPGYTGGLFGRKWSLFEGGIREPLIVYWKGHTPEGKTDNSTIISAIDLFPSICALLQISIDERLDGFDKSRALLGQPMGNAPPLMWEYASNPGGSIKPGTEEYRSPNLAIRDGDWKLLINGDRSDPHLYNLKSDRGEQNNLATVEKERVQELATKVISWRESMPVQLVVN